MIKFTHNLAIARKVLAKVNKTMEEHVAETCSVECYCNGREQGYAITQYCKPIKKVCFSENRNSDDIVVYVGESFEFEMGGNIPNEKVYRKKRFFRYDKIDEAAQFIVEFFAEGE
jgi:hypothetical protein